MTEAQFERLQTVALFAVHFGRSDLLARCSAVLRQLQPYWSPSDVLPSSIQTVFDLPTESQRQMYLELVECAA